MANDFEFKVDVDLGAYGGKQTFTSVNDFENWLALENTFWLWHQDSLQREPQANNVVSQFRQRISHLQTLLAQLKASSNIDDFTRKKDQLISQLNIFYKQNQLIHSSIPIAQFIKSLIPTNPVKAAYILRFLMERRNVPVQDINSFEAAIDVLMFEAGVNTMTSKSEKHALMKLHESWQEELIKSKKISEEACTNHELFKKEMDASRETQSSALKTWLEKSNAGYEALIKDAQKNLKAIEHTYDKKLALHSSINYWQRKFWIHVGSAAVLAIGVIVAFYWAAKSIKESMHDLIGVAKLSEVEAWKVGQVLLIATISVWVIRILIRLLLSQIHLWNDAIERRTMILTYLAMLREKELPEESRDLILQALFRPAATGILRDDGIPPFMAEWLKRTTGND